MPRRNPTPTPATAAHSGRYALNSVVLAAIVISNVFDSYLLNGLVVLVIAINFLCMMHAIYPRQFAALVRITLAVIRPILALVTRRR